MKDWFFLVLVFVVINSFIGGLYYPTGDMALFGIVGKHISEGKILPFFIYGQPYNGAATIFSYLLSLSFLAFGVNAIAYKLTMVFLSSTLLVIVYFFCLRNFDKKTAVISSLLAIFPPKGLIPVHLLFGDYLVAIILNFVFVVMFLAALKKNKYFFYAGFLAGVAYYGLEFAIPVIFVCLVVWLVKQKDMFKKSNFWKFLCGALVSLIPLAIYNVTHNFENLKQLLAGTFIHKIVCKVGLIPREVYFGSKIVDHCAIFGKTRGGFTLSGLITKTFPEFFGMGYYIIFLILIGFCAYLLIKNHNQLRLNSKYLWLAAFFPVYLTLYILSGFSDTKHLSPWFPFLLIAFALLLLKIKSKNGYFFYVLTCILLISGIFNLAAFESEEGIPESVHELNKSNVSFLYAPYNEKWGVIFNSQESIIVSCSNMCYCGASGMSSRYPLYEEAVEQSRESNFLIPEGLVTNITRPHKKIGNNYLFLNVDKEEIRKVMKCS